MCQADVNSNSDSTVYWVCPSNLPPFLWQCIPGSYYCLTSPKHQQDSAISMYQVRRRWIGLGFSSSRQGCFPLKVGRLVAAAAAKSLQSCPTLCDPMDGSPPGSPVPGILQAGTLEWVAISFCSAWKWKVKVKSLSRVGLFTTSWTAAGQAPPSMGFSRQEYWSGVPLPSLLQISWVDSILLVSYPLILKRHILM